MSATMKSEERDTRNKSRNDLRDAVIAEFGLCYLNPYCSALITGEIDRFIGVYERCIWKNVQLVIDVHSDISKQPTVFAYAPWLSPFSKRQNQNWADWHRFQDYRICYGHPTDWSELVTRYSNDKYLAEIAGKVLKKDVDFWLSCHRLAFENGLDNWQKEWPAYPHGSKR